jgi:hypothetical protein
MNFSNISFVDLRNRVLTAKNTFYENLKTLPDKVISNRLDSEFKILENLPNPVKPVNSNTMDLLIEYMNDVGNIFTVRKVSFRLFRLYMIFLFKSMNLLAKKKIIKKEIYFEYSIKI